MKFFRNIFLAGFLALVPMQAMSQTPTNCGTHEAITNVLNEQFQEVRQSIALVNNGFVSEVFANETTGTWSIIFTSPNGPTCVVAFGGDYQNVDEELPQGEEG